MCHGVRQSDSPEVRMQHLCSSILLLRASVRATVHVHQVCHPEVAAIRRRRWSGLAGRWRRGQSGGGAAGLLLLFEFDRQRGSAGCNARTIPAEALQCGGGVHADCHCGRRTRVEDVKQGVGNWGRNFKRKKNEPRRAQHLERQLAA